MIKKPKRSMNRFKLYSLTMLALAGVFVACSTNPKANKDKNVTTVTLTKTVPNNSTTTVTTSVDDKSPVFVVVEKMPQFPGGTNALMSYLGKNVHYPEKAKKDGVQGRVFVSFVVNKNGSISNTKIVRGLSPECDAEVVRVIEGMPKWIPGEQRGQKVRVQFNLPVSFKLK